MNLARQIFYFTRWGTSIIFIGFVTGIVAAIFPPLAVAGVVTLAAAFLLWALPELRFVPDKLLRKLFFVMIFVQLTVPAYWALQLPGLPWISVRRLFSSAVIILFSIVVAGSMSARTTIVETLRTNRALAVAVLGFLVTLFLSILTAVDWSTSLEQFSNAVFNWYIVLLACLVVVRSEKDIIFALKLMLMAGILVSVGGILEFVFERRFFIDVIPKSILDPLIERNPAVRIMYYASFYRDGVYRASSIYFVSLSFAEFEAMVAPLGAYFAFHGRDRREQILGISSIVFALLGIFSSGSRGGYVSFLASMPIMAFLWVARHSKLNPNSLVSGIGAVVFALGTTFTFLLVLFWQRANRMVFGYDDGDRWLQWDMALPHIQSNPITGHGMGSSGVVVGYNLYEGSIPSVDSYFITLLVENGVPGCLLFFGAVAIAVWIGVRVYLSDRDPRGALGSALACSLIAFATYRIALSQTENHPLVFILLGLIFVMGRLAYERRISVREPVSSTRSGQGALPIAAPYRANEGTEGFSRIKPKEA
jgi:hypothetical protein